MEWLECANTFCHLHCRDRDRQVHETQVDCTECRFHGSPKCTGSIVIISNKSALPKSVKARLAVSEQFPSWVRGSVNARAQKACWDRTLTLSWSPPPMAPWVSSLLKRSKLLLRASSSRSRSAWTPSSSICRVWFLSELFRHATQKGKRVRQAVSQCPDQ